MVDFYVTSEDRVILRELSKKQLEYSQLPVMKERAKLWYKIMPETHKTYDTC